MKYDKNTFIILLETDKSRCRHVKKIKDQSGINFNIFPGIDGRQLNNKDILELIKLRYFYENYWYNRMSRCEFTRGQLGCALSHIKLWEMGIRENKSFMIVFEDDIIFLDDYHKEIQNIMEELPSDYHYCYLYRHPGHQHLFEKDELVMEDKKYIQRAPPAWSTVGYIISLDGMKKFVRTMKPFFKTIDGMIMKIIDDDNSNCYAVKKSLVDTQGNLTSSQSQNNCELKSNVWNSGFFSKNKLV